MTENANTANAKSERKGAEWQAAICRCKVLRNVTKKKKKKKKKKA